jgi:hypothetical protein
MAGLLVAGAAKAEETAEFLKKFKDWAAYRHAGEKQKICFAATQPRDTEPKEMQPKTGKRGEAYFYLSFFPADGVKKEVMIRLGYAAKSGAPILADVGGASFKLFSKDEKAFIESADEEQRFVDALMKGNKLVVKGTASNGTATTDVYSLLGVSQAVKQAEDACL